jgi:hypothetical protein
MNAFLFNPHPKGEGTFKEKKMNTESKIKFVDEPIKVANPMQKKLKLDVNETHVRKAAEVLDETLHNAKQAQRKGVARMVFIP